MGHYYWALEEALVDHYWALGEALVDHCYWALVEVLVGHYYWALVEVLVDHYWALEEALVGPLEEAKEVEQELNCLNFDYSLECQLVMNR